MSEGRKPKVYKNGSIKASAKFNAYKKRQSGDVTEISPE